MTFTALFLFDDAKVMIYFCYCKSFAFKTINTQV